jgi:hypothetical protein
MAKWPDEHLVFARKLWEEGNSAAQVASQLNRTFKANYSRNAIIGKVHRAGWDRQETARRAVQSVPRSRPSPPPWPPRPPPPPDAKPPQSPPIEIVEMAPGELAPNGAASIWDLKAGQCKFPYGLKDYTFCGAQTRSDLESYCAYHDNICHQPGSSIRAQRRSRQPPKGEQNGSRQAERESEG